MPRAYTQVLLYMNEYYTHFILCGILKYFMKVAMRKKCKLREFQNFYSLYTKHIFCWMHKLLLRSLKYTNVVCCVCVCCCCCCGTMKKTSFQNWQSATAHFYRTTMSVADGSMNAAAAAQRRLHTSRQWRLLMTTIQTFHIHQIQ